MTTRTNNGRSTIATNAAPQAPQVPAVNVKHPPPKVVESQLSDLSQRCLDNSPQLLEPWAKVAERLRGGFTYSETITITEED